MKPTTHFRDASNQTRRDFLNAMAASIAAGVGGGDRFAGLCLALIEDNSHRRAGAAGEC